MTGNRLTQYVTCVQVRVMQHTPRNKPFTRSSPGAAPADVSHDPARVAYRTHAASTLGKGAALLQVMHWEIHRTTFLNPLVRLGHLQMVTKAVSPQPTQTGQDNRPAGNTGHASHVQWSSTQGTARFTACSGLSSTGLSSTAL